MDNIIEYKFKKYNTMNLNEKLQTLPKLFNSEYNYLIDTEEFELHPGILYEDSIIVYEYTSNIREIMIELFRNNIPFEHHISKDVPMSYLIIHISYTN